MVYVLFQLQIYTNFESNSQPIVNQFEIECVVSAANIYKFRKQFTTKQCAEVFVGRLFQLQIYTNFESNSQPVFESNFTCSVVSAANIYKFRKQFTTSRDTMKAIYKLFQLQIYTNFESNSQLVRLLCDVCRGCFSCKYIQISKAIHNNIMESLRKL